MTWIVPPQTLVLDIETIAGEPTEAEAWMRARWRPNPAWKPQTIGRRYLDMLEKKKERLALLDTAPIITAAFHTEADLRVLHWLPCDAQQVVGAHLERAADPVAMLRRVRDYLDQCGPETLLVGHNVKRFDLPKLRQAMIRHGVRLPAALVHWDQPVYDTMRQWSRFTLDEQPMTSLAELLDTCGLPCHKQIADGAMVPDLYEQKRYLEILAYAVADVVAERLLYLRMTGHAGETPDPQAAEIEN